ncbi:hypothetical protein ES708_21523 [subsurface metagenome]
MTSLVVRKVVNGGKLKLKLVPVVPKEVRGAIGLVKLERVQVICPACGQQVKAVASGGQVKGYCTVARQYVDFQVETRLGRKKWWQSPEYRAKLSAGMKKRWQDPEYRAKQIATHTGKHPTAETKAKLSAATTRQHNKRGSYLTSGGIG